MTDSSRVIGLIAGGRQFPVLIAQGVKARGLRLVVAAFTGHTNDEVAQYADVWEELKLGSLGKLLSYFKKSGVTHVVMAGTINKPKVMDLRHLDMRAMRLIWRIKGRGDAEILKAFGEEIAKEGMTVIPAHTYLPELLTPAGILTKRAPDEREMNDLRFGWKLAKELGKLDVGQCVVLKEKVIAAVEALEGTDATISRGCELAGEGGVVVKVFKPGQEEQVDLPSFGPDTIAILAAGKGTCIGVEAGKSLLFNQDETIAAANKAGIAIIGLEPKDI